jgi:hypothetical protein
MRLFPHAAVGALLALLALAPAATAAPLSSSDATPLVELDDTDMGALDWSLQANPGGNDGLSFFRSNSAAAILSLGNTGNVGLGTASPAFDLHINTNDTPGVRLEQNNTGGFTAQTWDVAGNEANFFVRDLTGGSQLPFRIRPGAPTSSIDIKANGDVGVGTASPGASLHVRRANGSSKLIVEEGSGTTATRVLGDLTNNGIPALNFTNTAAEGVDWQAAAGGDFVLQTQTGAPALALTPTGTATASGALQQNADAAAVENRADADPAGVLDAVTKLPVGYFEYAADPANARHLAPVGADFRAALGLGSSDAALAPADLSGVALVAIKGLAANDATFATKATVGSIDDRLKAAEAALGNVAGSVPSLAPVNAQVAAANKRIAALEKRNKALLKRLSKVEKTTKKLARKR